jgi:hypothetical protein
MRRLGTSASTQNAMTPTAPKAISYSCHTLSAVLLLLLVYKQAPPPPGARALQNTTHCSESNSYPATRTSQLLADRKHHARVMRAMTLSFTIAAVASAALSPTVPPVSFGRVRGLRASTRRATSKALGNQPRTPADCAIFRSHMPLVPQHSTCSGSASSVENQHHGPIRHPTGFKPDSFCGA